MRDVQEVEILELLEMVLGCLMIQHGVTCWTFSEKGHADAVCALDYLRCELALAVRDGRVAFETPCL